ncbi:U-box domain-containing protein 57 [Capsicum baccatum]|uniref:U-box domain-containing protein 57 n=1 Tax=Capsicum baccatum TaxID=33114 RepID=A0A2G2WCC5_CAPBA|nr:U-box domain-containing protein 57 [Capsicum baccatum]
MFVMDFTSSGRAWIEKIGEKLKSLCSEVDARSQSCPLERLDHSRGLYPWHSIDTLPVGVTGSEFHGSHISNKDVMEVPHIAADDYTYEGDAIKGWLYSRHDTSPMTNLKLDTYDLIPNYAFYRTIQE